MDYKFLRQRVVSQNIKNLKQKYTQSDLEKDQDPFQIYHYPKMVINKQTQQQIQQFIKGQIKKQINAKKFQQLSQKMREEQYILDKILQTQQLQLSSLNMIIQRLDQTVQQNFKVKSQPVIPKVKFVKGSQTSIVQSKQSSQQCDIQKQTNKKHQLKKVCIRVPAYSIQINENKKQNNYIQQKIQQNDFKKTVKYNSSSSEDLKINNIYQELQRQMAYLQYLKNDRKQYNKHKKRVNFLMKLFWKNAK